ncbi:hypothetical protein FHT40_003524 [Mycolicibacterium sp. BK556]|uniref:hypothetical protein n=1 Tax=Mycobacteriaceae TaxID=1762 RepID=UPI00105D6718|nr:MULTISPECIES: hypothetical protein [Mycobacteriaceae]MBB3603863.1 hypothetical protein [Mycolicibacterium sp. BK556]MBB3634058.1 hypothetical protein [Mycolicibacterium sp. BK607]TDO12153.1 hypothetical protein EV580_3879 [Mycobacterium sp. BK086]
MTDWSDPRLPSAETTSPRQIKRLSRNFAGVGVGIPPERLQEITVGGAAPTYDEMVDVTFALTATALISEKRRSKVGRAQRHCVRGFILLVTILIAINVLLCLGLMLFVLTQHTTPY